jgi:hypothetical protein
MYLVYKISITIICVAACFTNAWGFDPMAPPGYQQDTSKVMQKNAKIKPATRYILRQVVIGKEHKSAVINGFVVTEGEYVKSALVKSITENKVILQVKNKQTTLYLKPNTVKVRH